MSEDPKTKVDIFIRKIKNNPIFAWIVILGICVTALGQFLGAFKNIHDALLQNTAVPADNAASASTKKAVPSSSTITGEVTSVTPAKTGTPPPSAISAVPGGAVPTRLTERKGLNPPTTTIDRKRLGSSTVKIDVRIVPENVNSRAIRGTGILISNDGYILASKKITQVTCCPALIKVTTAGGVTAIAKMINASDNSTEDLAVLKIEGTGFIPAAISSDPVRSREMVSAIGFNDDSAGFLDGYVNTVSDRYIFLALSTYDGLIVGSPLIGEEGRVVGMLDGYVQDEINKNPGVRGFSFTKGPEQKIAFAIPGKTINTYLNYLRNLKVIPAH